MDLKLTFEQLIAAFVVLSAFFWFYSPFLVIIFAVICVLFLVIKWKYNYFKRKPIGDQSAHKCRPNASHLTANSLRYGLSPNVRPIKSARRQLSHETRTVDNYVSNYLTNTLNPNYFLQSDGLLSSMSGQSLSLRLHSPNDMLYSSANYRPFRESPNSQLGNIPFVKLSTSGSETSTQELKPKTQTIKPVTVRIAPMPHNLSKFTLNRMSNTNTNTNTPNVSTLTTTDNTTNALKGPNSSTQTKIIVDALKRKRVPKPETEVEEAFKVVTNKKAKRDSINSPQMANGLVFPNKQSTKRQAAEGTALLHKKFKNNEILSSYSSLQTPQLSQSLKTKRKLTPDLTDSGEVMTKKNSLPKDVAEYAVDSSADNTIGSKDKFSLSINLSKVREEAKEMASKRSYGLPLHLPSMEEHERDQKKARNRYKLLLNAVKEGTSPKKQNGGHLSDGKPKPKSEDKDKDEDNGQHIVSETIQTSSSAQIDLPSVPAAAIFTNSRIETIVTTTLLNTPISSVLTTTRELLSPQKLNVDNSDNCSMTSAPNSPEVSTIVTPFLISTPLSAPNVSLNSTLNESSLQLSAKPIANSTTSASMSSQSFVIPNNLFNNTSIARLPVSVPPQSTANLSTTLPVPQFTSSAPLPIPNFSQMPSNNLIPFTGSSLEVPNPQQSSVFSAEPLAQSLFSVGAGSTSNSRRIAQNSRLRSRQKR